MIQLFVKKLLSNTTTPDHYKKIASDWTNIKKEICADLSIKKVTKVDIFEELENQKKSNEFSFEKIFFVIEAIKRVK